MILNERMDFNYSLLEEFLQTHLSKNHQGVHVREKALLIQDPQHSTRVAVCESVQLQQKIIVVLCGFFHVFKVEQLLDEGLEVGG